MMGLPRRRRRCLPPSIHRYVARKSQATRPPPAALCLPFPCAAWQPACPPSPSLRCRRLSRWRRKEVRKNRNFRQKRTNDGGGGGEADGGQEGKGKLSSAICMRCIAGVSARRWRRRQREALLSCNRVYDYTTPHISAQPGRPPSRSPLLLSSTHPPAIKTFPALIFWSDATVDPGKYHLSNGRTKGNSLKESKLQSVRPGVGAVQRCGICRLSLSGATLLCCPCPSSRSLPVARRHFFKACYKRERERERRKKQEAVFAGIITQVARLPPPPQPLSPASLSPSLALAAAAVVWVVTVVAALPTTAAAANPLLTAPL